MPPANRLRVGAKQGAMAEHPIEQVGLRGGEATSRFRFKLASNIREQMLVRFGQLLNVGRPARTESRDRRLGRRHSRKRRRDGRLNDPIYFQRRVSQRAEFNVGAMSAITAKIVRHPPPRFVLSSLGLELHYERTV